MCARVRSKLAQHVVNVRLDRLGREKEALRDVAALKPGGDQRHDLALALGELQATASLYRDGCPCRLQRPSTLCLLGSGLIGWNEDREVACGQHVGRRAELDRYRSAIGDVQLVPPLRPPARQERPPFLLAPLAPQRGRERVPLAARTVLHGDPPPVTR